MKKLIVDVDDTISFTTNGDYANARPNPAVIERLREYREMGFVVVLATARNMRTYQGNVGKINVKTLPTLIDWLDRHEVPYDEIILGKPWCGFDGFYVDDKAVRPSEFVEMEYWQIKEMLDNN